MKIKLSLFFLFILLQGCKSTASNRPSEAQKFMMESMRPHLAANGNERYVDLFGASGCKQLLQVADRLEIIPTLIELKKVIIHADNGEELKFTYEGSSCPSARLRSKESDHT